MNIAVLAWGSLIWDPRALSTNGAFQPLGPKLPLEFSRLSGGNRLTLVIDETFGTNCATYATRSAFENIDDALVNLWSREGSKNEKPPADVRAHGRVGFIEVGSGTRSDKALERHPHATNVIQTWGLDHGYDAVIWTALASNFSQEKRQPFSVETAVAHLASLSALELCTALGYFREAPPEIQTPVRDAVNERWPQRQQ